MNASALREHLKLKSAITGHWMAVYLQTVPGSEEKICVAVAAFSSTEGNKVVRTLHKRSISTLFGSRTEGINKAIDWLVEDLKQHLAQNNNLSEWLLPISGFTTGELQFSGAASLDGLLEKAVSLSTSLGSVEHEEDRQQQYFITQFKEQLYRYNKQYKQFIDKPYRLNCRKVKFNVVTEQFIANIHGMNANSASYNAAMAKMVLLEDLKLDGLLTNSIGREFLISTTDNGNDKQQKKQIADLCYELERRDISVSTYDGPKELADSLSKRLSQFV